jgi:hypothetical protein
MAFPQPVKTGQRIDIMAPVSYFFHKVGESRCYQYKHLGGFLTRTTPECGANMITWKLLDDSVPEMDPVTFSISTFNPEVF